MTDRQVIPDGSSMHVRTSRIGLLAIEATAPVVAGSWSPSDLSFTVRIDAVNTGNPLLDPELHALVHRVTSGQLDYTGRGDGPGFSGEATAGDIRVPLDLQTTDSDQGLQIAGTTTFQNLRLPLPGMGHVRHLEVHITGHIVLS